MCIEAAPYATRALSTLLMTCVCVLGLSTSFCCTCRTAHRVLMAQLSVAERCASAFHYGVALPMLEGMIVWGDRVSSGKLVPLDYGHLYGLIFAHGIALVFLVAACGFPRKNHTGFVRLAQCLYLPVVVTLSVHGVVNGELQTNYIAYVLVVVSAAYSVVAVVDLPPENEPCPKCARILPSVPRKRGSIVKRMKRRIKQARERRGRDSEENENDMEGLAFRVDKGAYVKSSVNDFDEESSFIVLSSPTDDDIGQFKKD